MKLQLRECGRIARIATLILAIAIGGLLIPQSAMAYNLTGCKWPSRELRIDTRYVYVNFQTAINSAISNIHGTTQLNLTGLNRAGLHFVPRMLHTVRLAGKV